MAGKARIILAGMLCAIAFSVSVMGTAEAKPATLTKTQVERFLSSLPEVQMIGLREGLNISAEAQKAENPFAAVIEAVTRKELRDELKGVVKKHGFSSVKDWVKTGESIGHAYLHLTSGGAGKKADAKLDQHREKVAAELDKLGFLSDKQRRKLMQKFDQVSDDLGREPPAENVAVVRAMQPQIEAVVKGRPN